MDTNSPMTKRKKYDIGDKPVAESLDMFLQHPKVYLPKPKYVDPGFYIDVSVSRCYMFSII